MRTWRARAAKKTKDAVDPFYFALHAQEADVLKLYAGALKRMARGDTTDQAAAYFDVDPDTVEELALTAIRSDFYAWALRSEAIKEARWTEKLRAAAQQQGSAAA